MARVGRILAVTLGLTVVGAAFGALAGAVALALSLALTASGNLLGSEIWQVVAIAAIIGAVFGAIGAPAAGWLFLRRVPLGKVLMWSAIGTTAGGVAGWIVGVALRAAVNGPPPLFGDESTSAILGAVAGFLLAVVFLRVRASARTEPRMESKPPAA